MFIYHFILKAKNHCCTDTKITVIATSQEDAEKQLTDDEKTRVIKAWKE